MKITGNSNVKFNLIVYGDFPKNGGPRYKAYGAMMYFKVLRNLGLLDKVLLRGYNGHDTNFVPVIPLGSAVPRLLTFIQMHTGFETRNFAQNVLFDYFASKKISSPLVLSYVQGLKRCLKQIKSKGGIYVEVSTTENMEVFLEKLKRELGKFNLPLEKQIEKIFLNGIETSRQANYVIAISEHARQTYVNRGFDISKVFIIPQVVDIKRFSPARERKQTGKFRVLCVAHFRILKGLHYLIRAWKELDLQNAELVVVGSIDKNSKEAIRKFSGGISVNDNIKLIGPTLKTLDYYQDSDIFVSSSLTEGYGRTTAEAMACGLPVIVTEACGVEVRDGIDGFVINSGNTEQLKQKIKYFYSNRDKIGEMGDNARTRIGEICNIAETENKIEETIKKILINEKLL